MNIDLEAYKGKDLNELLEVVSVMETTLQWKDEVTGEVNDMFLYGVVTDNEGFVAYFPNEKEAFRYRLSFINRVLNDQ